MRYTDFKSYIQDNYEELLKGEISRFVNNHHDGIGFHGYSVLSLCEQKVDNVQVHSVLCHDENIDDLIRMDVNVMADIVEMGLGRKPYEADRKKRLFTVGLCAELRDGLKNVFVLSTEEFYQGSFKKEGALDAYLIPYISADQLEAIAEDFVEDYCSDAEYKDDYQFPYQYVMRKMGVKSYLAELPSDVFGRMYFRPARAQYYESIETPVEGEIFPGTMLINRNHYFLDNVGNHLNTIAHELVHWYLHQKFFELMKLLDADLDMFSCTVNPRVSDDELTGLQKAIWWAEWQANALAPRILMPVDLYLTVLNQIFEEERSKSFYGNEADALEIAIERVANLFGVSKMSAKIRAIQLGFREAEGVCLYVDHRYHRPFTFRRGVLGKDETFIINRVNFQIQMNTDKEFARCIDSGDFIYTGCVVCINDSLYVNREGYTEYRLTDYARSHVHECCLIFERTYEKRTDFAKAFYSLCYLSKEISSESHTKVKLSYDLQNQDVKNRAAEARKIRESGEEIMEIMRNLPNSFSGTLNQHIKHAKKADGRKMTNLELSSITGLSEGYIADLRKKEGLNVTLETVCALCIALHLWPCYSYDLIAKSRNDFPLTGKGYFMKYIIDELYTEPLEDINAVLIEEEMKPWGKNSS